MNNRDLVNKVSNSNNPQLNVIECQYEEYEELAKLLFTLIYGLMILAFIVCGIIYNINADVQLAVFGQHNFAFTIDKRLLLVLSICGLAIVRLIEKFCLSLLDERYQEVQLSLIYGTVTGLNKKVK